MDASKDKTPKNRSVCIIADVIAIVGFGICLATTIFVINIEGSINSQDEKPYGHVIVILASFAPQVMQFLALAFGGLIGLTVCMVGFPIALTASISSWHPGRLLAIAGTIAGPILLLISGMITFS